MDAAVVDADGGVDDAAAATFCTTVAGALADDVLNADVDIVAVEMFMKCIAN